MTHCWGTMTHIVSTQSSLTQQQASYCRPPSSSRASVNVITDIHDRRPMHDRRIYFHAALQGTTYVYLYSGDKYFCFPTTLYFQKVHYAQGRICFYGTKYIFQAFLGTNLLLFYHIKNPTTLVLKHQTYFIWRK